MSCDEIEALRLGLMNTLGTSDDAVRRHAEQELGDKLNENTPIAALAGAESVAELQRHLDATLVDLEEEVATLDSDDPEYAYTRGRLVAVRDAERSLARLADAGESFLDDLGDSHHTLHEVFPTEE
ncbi:hypothetical protein C463_00340 [Halorubrum californiense DSM 19288]|uniref:Cobalamin operon protein n=1 Tax=Halorubrum californiense DSM 19288 TaxID=1227465 RepID=M0EQ84_9EURY|nr:DUF3209 family protein [Halorubrum californiense]ELZ49042.1 hypothetical protein C463_00340 [Halorubrum californiense DSM 19288]